MHKIAIVFLFFVLVWGNSQEQECPPTQEIELDINGLRTAEVTVFQDRAEVKRKIEINPEQGHLVLKVSGLSEKVNPESIRVGGSGYLIIEELNFDTTIAAESGAESPEELDQRQRLEVELAELQEGVDALHQERQKLDKETTMVQEFVENALRLSATPSKEDGALPSVEAAAQLVEFFSTKRTAVDGRNREIRKALKEKSERISEIQNALDMLRRGAFVSRINRQVSVNLQVTHGGPAELVLTYQISGAFWSPSYDIRVASEDETLRLTYFGQVSQETGEDWKDANLVLSTASPSLDVTPPDLVLKSVRFGSSYRPHRNRVHMQKARVLSADAGSFGESGGMPTGAAFTEAADMMPEVQFSESSSSFASASTLYTTFSIPRPATILSDGKMHKVMITELSLSSSFQHFAVPEKSSFAYLKATTNNTSTFPLLGGEVSVFFDGTFIAHTTLDLVNCGETFDSYLGVDPAVSIGYTRPRHTSATAGWIQKSASKKVEQHMSIKNTKKAPLTISVRHSMPRSTDELIHVKFVQPPQTDFVDAVKLEQGEEEEDPGKALFDRRKGTVEWKLSLRPGEEINIPFEYKFEWPLDREIFVEEDVNRFYG